MNTLQFTAILLVALIAFIHCSVALPTDEELIELLKDDRGCDALVNSCGNKGKCCDTHDACYKKHGCTATSWLYLWGDCVRCNNAVMACIALKNPGKSSCCARGDCGQPWKQPS